LPGAQPPAPPAAADPLLSPLLRQYPEFARGFEPEPPPQWPPSPDDPLPEYGYEPPRAAPPTPPAPPESERDRWLQQLTPPPIRAQPRPAPRPPQVPIWPNRLGTPGDEIYDDDPTYDEYDDYTDE
jgi:hypothetical protein